MLLLHPDSSGQEAVLLAPGPWEKATPSARWAITQGPSLLWGPQISVQPLPCANTPLSDGQTQIQGTGWLDQLGLGCAKPCAQMRGRGQVFVCRQVRGEDRCAPQVKRQDRCMPQVR